ncbi:MAG: ATP-binding protein [Oscillospiraceae bacterium]|nr:ATP-binding protein [Oscillospiraceae bacterium]
MPKMIMTCGLICCGKTTYAKKLCTETHSVLLSVDEITLALLGNDPGELLDGYVEKLKNYFFEKSLEIISDGIGVVMDWGLWTRAERDYARSFCRSHGIDMEIHYLKISENEWKKRICARNAGVTASGGGAYIVDEGLAEKVTSLFEEPSDSECDVIVNIG